MRELLPQELQTKQAYDASAEIWESQHSSEGFWHDEMQRFHRLLPSGSVLEIGSGGGRDAKELNEFGYKYVGTDISNGLLKVARKKMPKLAFFEQSVYDLDVPGAPFDGFWASAVLLHVPRSRIYEALNRIHGQLRKSAIGFISLKDGIKEDMEPDEDEGLITERFFCYWSKENFESVLVKNGFTTVEYVFRPMSERTKWHCFFVESA